MLGEYSSTNISLLYLSNHLLLLEGDEVGLGLPDLGLLSGVDDGAGDESHAGELLGLGGLVQGEAGDVGGGDGLGEVVLGLEDALLGGVLESAPGDGQVGVGHGAEGVGAVAVGDAGGQLLGTGHGHGGQASDDGELHHL